MLCQRFSNPSILSFICPNYQDEVSAGRIVGVKEVRDESKEPQSAGYDDKFITNLPNLLEEFLLIFLQLLVNANANPG